MAVKTKVVNRMEAAKKEIPSTKFYPRTSCKETRFPLQSSNKPVSKDAFSATLTAMPGAREPRLSREIMSRAPYPE